jgi:hypothetical protein
MIKLKEIVSLVYVVVPTFFVGLIFALTGVVASFLHHGAVTTYGVCYLIVGILAARNLTLEWDDEESFLPAETFGLVAFMVVFTMYGWIPALIAAVLCWVIIRFLWRGNKLAFSYFAGVFLQTLSLVVFICILADSPYLEWNILSRFFSVKGIAHYGGGLRLLIPFGVAGFMTFMGFYLPKTSKNTRVFDKGDDGIITEGSNPEIENNRLIETEQDTDYSSKQKTNYTKNLGFNPHEFDQEELKIKLEEEQKKWLRRINAPKLDKRQEAERMLEEIDNIKQKLLK